MNEKSDEHILGWRQKPTFFIGVLTLYKYLVIVNHISEYIRYQFRD